VLIAVMAKDWYCQDDFDKWLHHNQSSVFRYTFDFADQKMWVRFRENDAIYEYTFREHQRFRFAVKLATVPGKASRFQEYVLQGDLAQDAEYVRR
jgi:hypothetical protein